MLARKVLLGQTRGYRRHPQLLRFEQTPSPVSYINAYLTEIYHEGVRRGFAYDGSKIELCEVNEKIPVTTGQLEYEWGHLKRKLRERSLGWYETLPEGGEIMQNPVFVVLEGGIEVWERTE